MYARSIASSKPLVRAGGSFTKSHVTNQQAPAMAGHEKLTIAKFTSKHVQHFPVKFTVCKGYYGPNEDLKFSEGDRFRAHSVKQSTVVNVEYDNGIRENISANSSVPFAILFDPYSNTKEAMKGYRFEKVSELVQLPVLPPVLWSRKSYHGSSPDSSVSANELLIVRRVKSKFVGRQQLKVYSHTHKKEKTLYTSCVGSFSTKPRDVALYLSDVLKHMPDIFPCRAIMLNPEVDASTSLNVAPHFRIGPCMVTLMHSSIDTSLVISSSLRQGPHSRMLEIPIDLGIMVKLDESMTRDENPAYEDASKYSMFDQPSQPHPPAPDAVQGSQFYTNVHFGQECSRDFQQQPHTFASVEAALEHGHYQTPRNVRATSDPIPIESEYHPPDLPQNYVVLSKEGRGSFEQSPGSREASSNSPSWRPPLPPPNKMKRERVRSPGYAYVETNPTRSTCVYNETQPTRGQAAASGDVGAISSSLPESADSDKSFGSSGSGGATVNRQGSSNNDGITRPMLGSGDGIVERSMRTSSISSAGYSYAKTNPPHPHHLPPQPSNLPTSPHHYSHLRSRSGPPVLLQMAPLSSQAPIPSQVAPSQPRRPIATTRLDNNTDSLVVVQRQTSSPPCSQTGMIHQLPRNLHRQESAPAFSNKSAPAINGDRSSIPDPLSDVIEDLTKMSLELGILEENIFIPDDMFPTSETAPARLQQAEEDQEKVCTSKQTDANVPPEVIEKHKTYLKAMDSFQVLRLLEIMGLEQYTPTFKQEQINGDILSTCDDAILNEELKVTSRLHRMRLLRVIEGAYSVHEIMSGKDGYIFMTSAGKQ